MTVNLLVWSHSLQQSASHAHQHAEEHHEHPHAVGEELGEASQRGGDGAGGLEDAEDPTHHEDEEDDKDVDDSSVIIDFSEEESLFLSLLETEVMKMWIQITQLYLKRY